MSAYQQLMNSCRDRTMIRNPYRGQCVSRTGAIGMPLAAMLASLNNGTWGRAYTPGAARCAPNAYNLATGKCAKVGDKRGVARAIQAFSDEYGSGGYGRAIVPTNRSSELNNMRRQLANARRLMQNRNTRNVARKVTGNIFGRVNAAERAEERRRMKNAGNNAASQVWAASAMAGMMEANAYKLADNLDSAREELIRKRTELTSRNVMLKTKNSLIAQKDAMIQDLIAQIDQMRGSNNMRAAKLNAVAKQRNEYEQRLLHAAFQPNSTSSGRPTSSGRRRPQLIGNIANNLLASAAASYAAPPPPPPPPAARVYPTRQRARANAAQVAAMEQAMRPQTRSMRRR
jgi:hypothetical protein